MDRRPAAGRLTLAMVLIALVTGLAAVSTSTAATAGSSAGAPPGSPALDQMALAVADVPKGAVVRRQGYVKDADFSLYYVREFKSGASLGKSLLLGLESDVGLTESKAEAATLLSTVQAVLKSKKGRQAFAKAALEGAGQDASGLKVTFGGVRVLKAGDAAFMVPMTFTLLDLLRFPVVLEMVRVDRVVEVLFMMGVPEHKLVPAEAARLVRVVAGRMTAGLLPVSLTVPTITGAPQEGQTLTAVDGSWTNEPTSYAHQWLRCDATGANCAPIDGATGQDYLLTTADVGATIEVSVVATNGVGSSQPALSAPTAVVVAAAPPPPAG